MDVLVVEDDTTSSKTLSHYVRTLGYLPLVAADGHAALETWHTQRPQIVLTDWIMPHMDGIELTRAIRETEADDYTYIIMVTSRDDSRDLVLGFESGVDDYLTKPVNKAELSVRLKSAERILGIQGKDMVIFSLAKLAETRDPETGLHLERIQIYCKLIAERLMSSGAYPEVVTRRFVDDIFITSPLHDIGKVGIPDRVLLKPEELNDAEFEIMKEHAMIGYNTLYQTIQKAPRSNYLKMAAEIARSHHECWDGSGYPDGISGEKIPISARILAVADVYDALVSKRVYKEAYAHDTAARVIAEGRGTHFDPVLVDAFLDCEQAFNAVLNRLRGR